MVILGNDGHSALSLLHTYSVPAGGIAIVTADFNGDGNLDLAVLEKVVNLPWSYSVLLGNGDGTFQSLVTYTQSAGSPSSSFVVADYNNDHKPDLAIAFGVSSDGSSQSVGILLGNGDGTFAAPVYYFDAAGSPLLVSDFNGDGKLDIAFGATDTSTSSLITGFLFGNGDGTFQPAVFPSSLNGFSPQFAADVNNDGKPDLMSGNQVALGNGDGTFYPAAAARFDGCDRDLRFQWRRQVGPTGNTLWELPSGKHRYFAR